MDKKTRPLIAFCALFCLLGGFRVVFADAPLVTDDFEGYAVGSNLDGQGQWATSNTFYVRHTDPHTGAQSAISTAPFATTRLQTVSGTKIASGYVNFWVKVTAFTAGDNWALGFRNDGVGSYDFTVNMLDGQLCAGYSTDCLNFIKTNWTNIVIEWTDVQYHYSVDGGLTYSSWHSTSSNGVTRMIAVGNGFDTFNVDDFQLNPIAGSDPVLIPAQPLDGQTTVVDYTNIALSGDVSVPTADDHTWTELIAEFKQSDGIDTYTKSVTLPNLTGSQSYSYSATTTIDISDADKAFEVYYILNGHLTAAPYTPYAYIHRQVGTYVTQTATPAGGIPLVTVPIWTPPPPENCAAPGLSFLEVMACKIQNTLLGMFIPSSQSVTNLFGTFNAFQTKFPFNYVGAIGKTIESIRTSLNESATITVKVFGQQGNVSLAFWQTPVTLGGISTTIGATIKTILSFCLLLIFLNWGLGYLHRIL